MTRGRHHYPFHFQLPDSIIPCSFESKIGTIRYYVRVNINIPYASCPQSIRYFTVVGPNIDCMDDRFLVCLKNYFLIWKLFKNCQTICCLFVFYRYFLSQILWFFEMLRTIRIQWLMMAHSIKIKQKTISSTHKIMMHQLHNVKFYTAIDFLTQTCVAAWSSDGNRP